MMYGFWGEGHTSDYPSPIPDPALAERTFVDMTERQIAAWRRVPLVVNTQPDISRTGNRAVLDRAVRGGCWLRSDSVILDEPEQIEELAHRPPWLAVVMEDGYHRHYRTDTPRYRVDAAGVDVIEHTMLHALDVGANYWSLWTEAGERRPLPGAPAGRLRGPRAPHRLPRAAVVGLAEEALRDRRAGRGLRQRRRRLRARRAAGLRRDAATASRSRAAASTPATPSRAGCASPRSCCRRDWAGARCACGPSSR